MTSFLNKLETRWHQVNSLVCVGLDPDPERLPQGFNKTPAGVEGFLRAIIDSTQDLVCAFKPQVAHFSAIGAEPELERLITYIHDHYPDIPVILDSKRGDIGSTAGMYAREAFERYQADAVTVNPYMGEDSIEPFARYSDKGVFVLCRTSNPSAPDLQHLDVQGDPLYLTVASRVETSWNRHGNLGMVVGATAAAELRRVRAVCPTLPLLVPGLGTQGGDAEAVLQAGLTAAGTGLIINASRSVLYASSHTDFAQAARAECENLFATTNRYRP